MYACFPATSWLEEFPSETEAMQSQFMNSWPLLICYCQFIVTVVVLCRTSVFVVFVAILWEPNFFHP